MTDRRAILALLLAVLVILPASSPARAAEPEGKPWWPQWRGPSGQGLVDDTHVPLEWGEGKNLLWKAPLPGHGNSTPVIWGDRLFLTAASPDGRERMVLCFRTSDGKLLWQQTAAKDPAPARIHAWNSHASPSCVTDGRHVWAFFGTPGLFCYDMDGRLAWQHSFGVFTTEPGWGTGASPCLAGDLVIQNCDNDGAAALPSGTPAASAAPQALVALDKTTGKERWRTPRNQGRGFSTPLLWPAPDGRPEVVLNGPRGVWAYDPASGKELWHCERPRTDDSYLFGEPLPVTAGDTLVALSGRPGPFQAIRRGGQGDVTATGVLWTQRRKGSRDVASPIVCGGRVYACDNGGLLQCYDVATGQPVYPDRQRLGTRCLASPILLRGKLLFLMESGEAVLVEPGPAFKVAGRNALKDGSEFRASPAVADGRLFLRSQTHLYCIGTGQQ